MKFTSFDVGKIIIDEQDCKLRFIVSLDNEYIKSICLFDEIGIIKSRNGVNYEYALSTREAAFAIELNKSVKLGGHYIPSKLIKYILDNSKNPSDITNVGNTSSLKNIIKNILNAEYIFKHKDESGKIRYSFSSSKYFDSMRKILEILSK